VNIVKSDENEVREGCFRVMEYLPLLVLFFVMLFVQSSWEFYESNFEAMLSNRRQK